MAPGHPWRPGAVGPPPDPALVPGGLPGGKAGVDRDRRDGRAVQPTNVRPVPVPVPMASIAGTSTAQ